MRCKAWTAGRGRIWGRSRWFVGVWVVMMAAMMFPSVAPTVALYSRMTKSRSPVAPLLFTSGYLARVDEHRNGCLRGCDRRRTHLG